MTIQRRRFISLLSAAALSACRPAADQSGWLDPELLPGKPWDDVVAQARGSSVRFGMWAGEEDRNRYFRGPVHAAIESKLGVDLVIVPTSDVAELINKLLNEKAAGKRSGGSLDMVWINGENFRTAKEASLLWGPFASSLPNIRHYLPESYRRDFGTPVEGFEAPWQRAHFVLAYDTARTADPPRSIPALGEWIRRNPGRFTYVAPPDYAGSAFLRHVLYHFGGGPEPFQEGFDEALYQRSATPTFAWLNELQPHLWRNGETYPFTQRELNRLFANSEIDFSMNYGPSFASLRIERGEFPPTTRTFVFETGTIGNYNFLAIPFNATNVAGALVTINYLLSYDAALDASRTLRSSFPLALNTLTPAQREAVAAVPRGVATLPDDVLSAHHLPEADARYLDRLERDWRQEVLLR